MPVRLRVTATRAGIRNAYTRMPFRFGVITMRASPVLTLEVEIEDGGGRRAKGWAADFLAFRWFDKRPEKSLADNCADLIRTVEVAGGLYLDAGRKGPDTPFDLFLRTYPEIERVALGEGFNRLGASFGSSMLERAVIDAAGRLLGKSLFALVQDGDLGIELGKISPELGGRPLGAILPGRPLERLHLRHTVGLVDPITAADVGQPVDDGLPETLEDYLREDGISHLKIKVGGNLAEDLARLEVIAGVLGRFERAYRITLDGNEQYKDLGGFLDLVEGIRGSPRLARFWADVLFIEQPLERSVALDPHVAPALRALAAEKPVIIDEADGWLTAFKEAVALGYRGTSHKNCKGIYKSLHNLALATLHNQRVGREELFLSAEDLTNLPVVPLQADLAMVALLGIAHVERNGHHYFRGLGHLTASEKADALARHPDLYQRRGDEVFLRIEDGMLLCRSLQVPGMGFAALPDMDAMTAPREWDFASLGQEA
jgi:L-alanine-DL-glutamate epimerase-like enolase superfamily enzyme